MEPNMKPSEIMTWAGPLPPNFAEPFDETSEAKETMTFAGPLQASVTDAVEVPIEPITWAGPLPPDGWMPVSRKFRKLPTIGLARARRAEAKA